MENSWGSAGEAFEHFRFAVLKVFVEHTFFYVKFPPDSCKRSNGNRIGACQKAPGAGGEAILHDVARPVGVLGHSEPLDSKLIGSIGSLL